MSRAEDRRDMGDGRYSFPQLDAVMRHGTAPGGDVDLPHRAYWAAAGAAGSPPVLEPCFSALPPPPRDEVRLRASRGWWPCVQVPPHDEPLPPPAGAEGVPPWLLAGSGTSLPHPVPRGDADVDMDGYDEDLAHRGWWLDNDSPVASGSGSDDGGDSEGACMRLLQRFEHLDMGLVFEIMAECNYDAEAATVMLDEVLTQMQQYEADARLAQELQREYRGAQHLHDDEELAKRLQHELSASPHYDDDAALAKQLQAELGAPMDAARLSADEALARQLQREMEEQERAPRPPLPAQVVFPTEALALCEMFPEVEPEQVLRVWEKCRPSHVAAVDALQNYSAQSRFTTPTSTTTASGGHVPVFFDEAGASSHVTPHGPAPQASSATPTWVWGGNKQRALHVGSPKKKHRGTGLIDLQAMFPELDKGVVKSVFAQAHGDASRTASLLMQMQDELLHPPTKHQAYPMPPEERVESAPSKLRGPRGKVYGGKKQGFKTVKRKQREQQKRDTDRLYNQLRASAAHHSNLRSVYAHQAAVAYGQGDRAMAKEYSQKAKREALLAEEAHKKASHEIFQQRNRAQDHNTIDMHGLHVGESIRVVTNYIAACTRAHSIRPDHHAPLLTLVGQLPPENIPPTLNVIVGLGKHSRGGAKIKPAVEEFLREQHLSFRYPSHNRGLMIVDLSPLIERRHGDMRR